VDAVGVACARAVAQGDAVEVQLSLASKSAEPGRHIVRLNVTGPNGAMREHYGANIEVKGGRASHRLHLALNDPTGRWRLTARDVASGVEGACELVVKEGV